MQPPISPVKNTAAMYPVGNLPSANLPGQAPYVPPAMGPLFLHPLCLSGRQLPPSLPAPATSYSYPSPRVATEIPSPSRTSPITAMTMVRDRPSSLARSGQPAFHPANKAPGPRHEGIGLLREEGVCSLPRTCLRPCIEIGATQRRPPRAYDLCPILHGR